MKAASIKYIFYVYLYRIIDDKYVFEYNWTDDTWWFCKGSTILALLDGEELTEEAAIKKAKEFKKNLADKPYKRIYALSPFYQV